MGSLVKKYTKEKLTGQIFTPFSIVNKILDDIGYNTANILQKRILDPACGDGRFLIKIAERIIKFSKNSKELTTNLSYLYGWDTDEIAISIAKKELNKLIRPYNININWNIFVLNSLHKGIVKEHLFNQNPITQKFDFIVGNPPYIRIQHLSINERTILFVNQVQPIFILRFMN